MSSERLIESPAPGHGGLLRAFDAASHALGRRVLYLLLVLFVSLAAGLAVPFVKLPLLIGALLSFLFVFLVVRNPYIGLLAYLVIFSLRLAEVVPALAPLKPERVVGLLTFLVVILSMISRKGGIAFDRSRQTRHFYFLVLAAFLSVPFAYWRWGAWMGVIDYFKLLMYYLMVVHVVNTRARLKGFIWLQCLLIFYLAFDSTFHYLKGALLHAQGIDRAVGTTSMASGPNELGATMACTIPLFMLMLLNSRMGRARFFFGIGLGMMLCTLVITGSRSALIGFVGSMGYFAWHTKHRVPFMIAGGLLLIGAFAVMPEQYKERYSTITSNQLDGSSSERIKVWGKGLRMIADRPLTGVGIHCFGAANAMGYSTGRRSWLESHSLYVQVPAEMGLIGAFAFFAFMFQFLRLNRRTAAKLNAEDDEWHFERTVIDGMFAGYVALLFTGVFGHSMMRDTWYLYAALGLATARIWLDHRPDVSEAERRDLLR